MPHHHVYWHNHLKRYNNMMFCGPSRLVWFGIGSVATWAWIHHHRHRDQGSSCPRRRVDYNRGRAQWEERGEEAPPPAPPGAAGEWRQTPSFSREWALRPQQGQSQGGAAPPLPNTRFDGNTHVVPSGSGQREQQPLAAAADSERLWEISRGAEDTISDMSEATIDTMMGALQRLKDRLAERRGDQQLQEVGSKQINPTPATSPEEPPRTRHWV